MVNQELCVEMVFIVLSYRIVEPSSLYFLRRPDFDFTYYVVQNYPSVNFSILTYGQQWSDLPLDLNDPKLRPFLTSPDTSLIVTLALSPCLLAPDHKRTKRRQTDGQSALKHRNTLTKIHSGIRC